MKKIVLLSLLLQFCYSESNAQVVEKKGYVAIEMESTKSPLGNWKKVTAGDPNFIPSASGGAHLEFTGNNPNSGPADSPLEYTFKIKTAGTYHLMIRASKRLDGLPGDKCNDSYVRVEGDFTSPYTGAADKEPDATGLSSNQKMFGGLPHPNMGWCTTLDYLGHIKKKPRYVFKAGETYKITFSGRAQRFNPDYFVIYNESMFTQEEAQLLSPTGKLPATANVSDQAKTDSNCWTKGFSDTWDLSKPDGYLAQGIVEANRKAFQINTIKEPHNEWATAKTKFDGETGTYNVLFSSMLETDGECFYKVLVDGKVVLDFQNKRILGTDKKDYSIYTAGAKGIKIAKGAVVQVDFKSNSNGLVPEKDSFAWARGRWQSISIGKCQSVPVDIWVNEGHK
jgi:hypothetical protein